MVHLALVFVKHK